VQERASPQTRINDSDGYDDTENHSAPLSDVFSIMDYHTSLMDRITEACFLKTRHRGVGGMSLVECMDTILRVGKLVMDLRTGRLAENDGEPKLAKLVDRFGTCLNNLITGLKILDESGHARPDTINDDVERRSSATNRELQSLLRGGQSRRSDATGLPGLLLRLDASRWHSREQDHTSVASSQGPD